MSQHWLEPDWKPETSISSIPIKHFIDKGIKALVLDVDGTLLHSREVELDATTKNWVEEAKLHLIIHLLSNNPSRKRIGNVAKQLNISYTYAAAKPRRNALRFLLQRLKLNPKNIAIIGDRVFTEVLAGNRLGVYTVLVQPIDRKGRAINKDNVQRLEQTIARWLGAKQ